MLSFLDAFFGYHQIPMHPLDAEKMAFIRPHGLYCYNMMPFGLKNTVVTYQRLVTKLFRSLIGRTMEVYIDDMLVKTRERPNHTKHLQETFDLLRTNGMKLNPLKCAFEVSSGKFLGLGLKLTHSTQSHYGISTSYHQKRSATVDWPVSGIGAVHLSLYRSVKVVFQHLERGQTFRMGYRT